MISLWNENSGSFLPVSDEIGEDFLEEKVSQNVRDYCSKEAYANHLKT